MESKYNDTKSILDATRIVGANLQREKDNAKIAVLTEANTKLKEQNAEAIVRYGEYKSASDKLEKLTGALQQELVTKRFLGWGRKRWIQRTLHNL